MFRLNGNEHNVAVSNSDEDIAELTIIPVKQALLETQETIYWVKFFDNFLDAYEMPSDEYIYVDKRYSPSSYIYSVNLQISEHELRVGETGDTLVEIDIDIYQCIIEAQSIYFSKPLSKFYESDVAAKKLLVKRINSAIRKRVESKES